MLFVHENNMKNKIESDYGGIGNKINKFYHEYYLPTKNALLKLDFNRNQGEKVFKKAAAIANKYYTGMDDFIAKNPQITSQSKFRSTFLEEFSIYLFEDDQLLRDESLGFYNKGIYAGMQIGNNLKTTITGKDVDFCIGKKINIQIDAETYEIILPVIAVEVKTYLDATMLNEVQYSSRLLKNAVPRVKTYVLMEHNQVGEDKIVAARCDGTLNEIFVLRKSERDPIDAAVLGDYYQQLSSDISEIASNQILKTPGRLING